jgi:hypothetical protein
LRDSTLDGLSKSARTALLEYKAQLTIGQSVSYYKSWMLFAVLAFFQFAKSSFSFLRKGSTSRLDKSLLIAAVSVLFAFAYYFGGRYATNHYTLYAFLPLYQLLAFRLVLVAEARGAISAYSLLLPLIVLAAFLSLLQPIQAALLFPYYLSSGSTYRQTKAEFELIDTVGCTIVYTTAVAWLDDKQSGSEYMPDELGGIVETERMRQDKDDRACVVAFVQEVNSNSLPPAGMQLIADLGDKSPYTQLLRSLRILNSPKGYSFRAYKGSRVSAAN